MGKDLYFSRCEWMGHGITSQETSESPKSHMRRGCSNNNTLTALGPAVIIIMVYPVFTEMDEELQASSTV
jgi:hypothetical protein